MGKATKWIRNFLLGKKEEKNKKNGSLSAEYPTTTRVTNRSMGAPNVKRRWSFGRKTGKLSPAPKCSASFDSIDAAKLPIESRIGYEFTRHSYCNASAVLPREIENAAAIKIQATFRSHLARKALHALKGLVKLQALVRGHLVRKQASATLRSMHALMAIQVRARIQRIQMAEESHLLVDQKQPLYRDRNFPKANSLDSIKYKEVDMSTLRSGHVKKHSSHMERHSIEPGFTTFYAKHVPVSQEGHHKPPPPNYKYPRNIINKPMSPSKDLSCLEQPKDCYNLDTNHLFFLPNYMNNTASSKAKVRSQSEPKRRPKWDMGQKSNKQTTSANENIDPLDVPKRQLSSNSKRHDYGDVDFITRFYEKSL